MIRRHGFAVALTAIALAACGQVGESGTGSGRGPSGYLYLEGGSGIAVIEAASGRLARTLPAGTPTPDWRGLYSVGDRQLKVIDPATGEQSHTGAAPAWADAVHTSPNGSWLVFTGQPAAGSSTSQFQIQDSAFAKPPVQVTLPGRISFDGISNDGRSLFLLQWVSPGTYLVRRYDVDLGRLFDQVIAEKGEKPDPMSGLGVRSAASADGKVQVTLYLHNARGQSFLHELPLMDNIPFAFCVDLPPPDVGWDLVAAPDGRTFLAVNPAAGLIVESSPQLESFDTNTNQRAVTPLGAGPTSAAALSPGGSTLYMASGAAVEAVDLTQTKLGGRATMAAPIASLAAAPDGSVLYALSGDQLLILDPKTLQVTRRQALGEIYRSIIRVT